MMLLLALEHLILYIQLAKYNLKKREFSGYYTNKHSLISLIEVDLRSKFFSYMNSVFNILLVV